MTAPPKSPPRLMLLHGFTGAPASWEPVLAQLPAAQVAGALAGTVPRAMGLQVLAPPLLGHAGALAGTVPMAMELQVLAPPLLGHASSHSAAQDFLGEVDRLAALARPCAPLHLAGYSLGARLGLWLLIRHPALFSRATLIGVQPGLPHAERPARRQADAAWAQLIEHQGLAAFCDRWQAQPLFGTQSRLPAEVLARQQALREAHDPAGLRRAMSVLGLGDMPDATPHLAQITAPVQILCGALDQKFVAIGRELAARLPRCELRVVEGAGHNLLLEDPAAVAAALQANQDRMDPGWTRRPVMSNHPTPPQWKASPGFEDIRYEKADGIAKITINRPEVRNAFRPQTVSEMMRAFSDARDDSEIGVVILTGEGDQAFCAGGDQRVRGSGGYVGKDGVPRLNVLDLQRQIRTLPKPVIAMVAGYAIGGGHVLHMMCDLTIAAENARFGQTGPKVGSFDGGYGAAYMARIIGQKRAREIWFLCRQYTAAQALDMGLVNAVVPLPELEAETVRWCGEILQNSPLALRCLKAALNADCDGQAGLQELAGNATLMFYMTEEGREGKEAFLQKRPPNFRRFSRLP